MSRYKATGITDSSDNELLIIAEVASAVNEITLTNAATGNAPSLAATGGDTNIDLVLTPKGTGGVKSAGPIKGNGTGPSRGYVSVSYASDANKTLSQAEYECGIIDIAAGVVTATRNLVFPLTAGARWIVRNRTAQSIQCIGASGTGTTIATVKAAEVYSDGTNISRATADVTV